jgi:hypothetical protein
MLRRKMMTLPHGKGPTEMTDERIIAYLLKDLPEEEAERFEDECLAYEEWPAQVSLVEEDLIDDYLRNELAPGQRRSFERNYLTTPARLERVRIAAALLRHIDARAPAAIAATPPVKPTWFGWLRASWGSRALMPRGAVALAVVALTVGAWWLSGPPTAHRPAQTFATLTLTISNSDRAEGSQDDAVKLTRDIDALRITLVPPEALAPATRYRVQLEDDDRAIIFSENVQQEDQSIRVTIPASQLARRQYALKLFAVEPDGTEQRIPGSYRFTVE